MATCYACSGNGSRLKDVTKSCSSCNSTGKAYGYGQICGRCSGSDSVYAQETEYCAPCGGTGQIPDRASSPKRSSSIFSPRAQPKDKSTARTVAASPKSAGDFNGPMAVLAMFVTTIAVYDAPKDNFGFALTIGIVAAILAGKYYKAIIAITLLVVGFYLVGKSG